MSFSDRTMTEPYTSREVSTVPGEGDANLLLQDSKAAAPYSTFLDMDSSQIVTMRIQSVDQNRAIKTVKRTITELDRSKIEEVRPDRALCSVA